MDLKAGKPRGAVVTSVCLFTCTNRRTITREDTQRASSLVICTGRRDLNPAVDRHVLKHCGPDLGRGFKIVKGLFLAAILFLDIWKRPNFKARKIKDLNSSQFGRFGALPFWYRPDQFSWFCFCDMSEKLCSSLQINLADLDVPNRGKRPKKQASRLSHWSQRTRFKISNGMWHGFFREIGERRAIDYPVQSA